LVLLGSLAVVVAQLLLEGFRWQLVPLYLVALALGFGDLLSMERKLPWWRRVSRPALGLIGVGMMCLPPAALPVPRLPQPTGDLPVGTATFAVRFPDRLDPYGSQPATVVRQLAVQVWYPAENDGHAPGPWTTDLDLIGPRLSRRLGFPGFFLSHTVYSPSHARPNATPLPGTFPVVLYSHDLEDFRTVALSQLEALASRGYFVVAPDHAHLALVSRLPDGTVIDFDPRALASDLDEAARMERARHLEETMKDDLVGILDALSLESGPFGSLAAHADVGRVAVFGRGAGGGVAVWLCVIDPRCRGAAGFNPWVDPLPDRVAAEPTSLPMMFIRSTEAVGTPNDGRLRGLAERSEGTAYWIRVAGTESNDFVMAPLFSPVAERLGMKGSIGAERIVPIVDRFLAGFFDHTLLDAGPAAIERNPFPEVSLEIIG
jgi:dienelactone hydrolase